MRLALLLSAALALAACKNELVCPQGQTDCGGRCVSLLSDRANCGACGAAVGVLEVCAAGTRACAPDVAACGGACADVRVDAANCGACGTACGAEAPLCKTDGGGTGCVATCPEGQTACGTSCADLAADPRSCGTCGHACAPGEACRAGACRADVLVACYWTNEVVPVTPDLAPAGEPIVTPAGPQSVAISDGVAYAVTGWPAAYLSGARLGTATPFLAARLPGSDLATVVAHDGLLYVANASVGTVEVLDPAGAVLDELPLPRQSDFPNPRSIAFVGSRAYVVLSNPAPFSGAPIQEVVAIDFSRAAACAAPDPAPPACGEGHPACAADRRCVGGACRVRCGDLVREIDLAIPGAADGAAVPSPEGAVAVGTRVVVPLANLESAETTCDGQTYTWFLRPAGNGRLAVIDAAADDALSIVDLGPGCKAPAEVAVDGARVWVSCGSMCFQDLAPGAVVAVDLSRASPVVGAATSIDPVVGGAVAVCGGKGYVADLRKTGLVVPFDPATGAAGTGVAVCGFDAYGDSLASAIACSE